jgi:hypothetical protein
MVSIEEYNELKAELDNLRKQKDEALMRRPLNLSCSDYNELTIIFGNYIIELDKSLWLRIFENEDKLREVITNSVNNKIDVFFGKQFKCSLYRNQWLQVLYNKEVILNYIKEHNDKLSELLIE